MSDLNEILRQAKQRQLDAARPDIVQRVHGGGKLTARERIEALLDPDSAVEYGSIAALSKEGEWVAEAGGVDYVGTIDGQTAVVSSTDYTDHGGGYGAGRLGRLFGLAQEHRWPVVIFVDGGGSRARHPRAGRGDIELSGAIGRFTAIDGMAELSGWVPTVAIVSGPSFAGHASLAGFSDFLIATRGSSIGMGGPPMVEAALGKRLSPNELAGAEMHETGGGIDLLVDDERAAIEAARRYLAFYASDADPVPPSSAADHVDSLIPRQGDYDVCTVIDALVDADSRFELRPRFAPSVVTALARIEGRTVGMMANQPLVDDGTIDTSAATKIARFVELCDAYEYPVVALADSPGCSSEWPIKGEAPATAPIVNRWHARPVIAHQHRSVPLIYVQMRRARGMTRSIMAGYSSALGQPLLCLGWPTVEIGYRDGFSAMHSPNAFDDVVAPSETRERIAKLLRHVGRKLDRGAKKHTIDSW